MDKKDTMVIIRLDKAASICADNSGLPHLCIDDLRVIQITGDLEGLGIRAGTRMSLVGQLSRSFLPWHYTPVVFRVERVPTRMRT